MNKIIKKTLYMLVFGTLVVGLKCVSFAKIDHHNNHKNNNNPNNHNHSGYEHSSQEHSSHDHSKHDHSKHENKSTKLELVDGITIAKIQTSAECDKCKKTLEKAINRLDGIKSSNLDVESRVLTVKFKSDDISLEKIKSVINKTGYDADETKADPKAYDRLPDCCKVGGMD